MIQLFLIKASLNSLSNKYDEYKELIKALISMIILIFDVVADKKVNLSEASLIIKKIDEILIMLNNKA